MLMKIYCCQLKFVVMNFPLYKGLPSGFCKAHLPPREYKMVLEDEEGGEFDAVYIGKRTGLSGGWRGFSMHHELEDGDSLVFELTEPDRFKVLFFYLALH
jgi:hypothetical protein